MYFVANNDIGYTIISLNICKFRNNCRYFITLTEYLH